MSSLPVPLAMPGPAASLQVVEVPEVPTAVVKRSDFPMYEMAALMDATFSHLAEALEGVGIRPIGPAFALHHRGPVDTADLEAGFPVDRVLTETLTLPSDVEVIGSVLPAGRVSWISHVGSYAGLGEAWGQFTEAVGESEEQMSYPFWELYVTEPTPDTDPATLRTDLVTILEPREV